MALQLSDLKRIHLNKLATPGKKYYGDDDEVYLGTSDRRLERMDKAKVTVFKPTPELNTTNIQSALEQLVGKYVPTQSVVEIDFGYKSGNEETTTELIVKDFSIRNTSILEVKLEYTETEDHTSEEYLLDEIRVGIKDIIPSSSYTIVAYAPNGTFGKYKVRILKTN